MLSSLLGIASGYFGGAIDMVIQRYVDFMFALPGLLIAIVVVGVVGGGYWLAVGVLSLLNFSGDVRIVRGAVIEQRPLPYVEAARTLGVPRRRIMYVHILRNIAAILFANAALDFALSLVALAGLAFLGLGSGLGLAGMGADARGEQGHSVQQPSSCARAGLRDRARGDERNAPR